MASPSRRRWSRASSSTPSKARTTARAVAFHRSASGPLAAGGGIAASASARPAATFSCFSVSTQLTMAAHASGGALPSRRAWDKRRGASAACVSLRGPAEAQGTQTKKARPATVSARGMEER